MTKGNDTDNMLYKSMTVSGIGMVDEEQGIVEAFVSGIGNKDSVDDIIEPGAFDESIKVRKPKGVWSHNWDRPVAKTLEIFEVPKGDSRLPERMKAAGIGGLYVKSQFNLETQDGRDALSWVKFYGDESEWSIGYQVDEQEYDRKVKANRLKQISLYEYSPVLFGANPLTATVGVKTVDGQVVVQTQGVDSDMSAKVKEAVEKLLSDEEVDPEQKDIVPGEGDEPVKSDDGEQLEAKDDDSEEVKDAVDGDPDDEDKDDETKDDETKDEPKDEEVVKPEKAAPSAAFLAVKSILETSKVTAEEAMDLKSVVRAAIDTDNVKVIPGSWEERRHELSEAVSEAFPDSYSWVYATFDSSVIFCTYDYRDGEDKFFEASYSLGEDGVTLGDMTEVDVVEVVVAKHAIVNAVFKGHAGPIKSLLKPFIDVSVDSEEDVDVKSALDFKAGASISAANRAKLEDVYELIGSLLNVESVEIVEPDLTTDSADESKDENKDDVETKDDNAEVVVEEQSGLVTIDPDDFAEFQRLAG